MIGLLIDILESFLDSFMHLVEMLFSANKPDKEIRTRYENGEKITEIRYKK